MKKVVIIACMYCLCAFASLAQTKIKDGTISGGGSLPNVNSILELESNNKGFLLPRVALLSTSTASPLASHIAGMTVYNNYTAGSGLTAVSPGFYYNDGTQWIRLSGVVAYKEPWNVQESNDAAENNTQDIYQTGKVAIGANSGNSTLTVNGSLSLPIKHISADYTISDNDYTIIIDESISGNPITITLPDADATNKGRIYQFATFTYTNSYILQSNSIYSYYAPPGAPSLTLGVQQFYTVQSDGQAWYMFGNN